MIVQQSPPISPAEAEPPTTSRADKALVVAWVASIAVHIMLFTVMVALPWITDSMGADDTLQSAVTDLRQTPEETRFTVVPTKSPFQAQTETQRPADTVVPQERSTLDELTKPVHRELNIVGIGTGGGEFSKYGLRAGPGAGGPQFFGLGGEARAARRIVYVVDRSGSMMDIFGDLRKELKRSIDHLRKSQKFHVIFYSTDPPIENPPKRLVNAIRSMKDLTFDFLDGIVPAGMTEPIEAMRRAFQLRPDLIYFLSDGDIPVGEQLKEELRQWNHDEKVRIFTIAYVSSAGRQLLEDIARENNGKFRFVSEYDLEP